MLSNAFFVKKIKESLPMPFFQYMEMALYDHEFGYYTSQSNIIGQTGDFITAPELSPLFAKTLAKQISEVTTYLSTPSILELGAGTGRLCVNLMIYLEQFNLVPEKYYILEISPSLKKQQHDLIQKHIPHLLERICWLASWPEQAFEGVVLANEVLDAMPVHRFEWRDEQVLESHIIWDDKKQGFQETFMPSQNAELIQYVSALGLTENIYRSEVNLWVPGWLSGIYHCLKKGVVFLIDYGFPRSEYYHPDRCDGTLMTHQRQKASTDFLSQPGLMDMTAHVDFTHIAEKAFDLGFYILGYTQQAAFLLANGILDELALETNTLIYHQEARNLKILLQSHEMGEIFKVMALGKNFQHSLKGFSLQDKRAHL